ncbi:hypothetical protein [Aquifex aeolicus]|nr:hypothetical protein [Aquifex aeolicus]
MEKFIQKFFEELYLILFDYALKIAQNPIDELLIFGSIAIAYTVIYISGLFFARKINLPYIRKILEIGISVIFYFLVSLLEGKFPQVESLLLLKTLFLVQTIRVFILSLEAFQAFGFTTKLLINIFSILGGISFFIIKLSPFTRRKI